MAGKVLSVSGWAVLALVLASDTVGGTLARAAVSVWMVWAGFISEESYARFALGFHGVLP